MEPSIPRWRTSPTRPYEPSARKPGVVGLQLNLENVFDKEYFVSAHNDNNITPGSPRAAYLSARFRF
jgi:outer membrane receptor for monomeric catechols